MRGHGGVEAFLRAFLEMPKKKPEAMTAINIAAMAMAIILVASRHPAAK